MHARVRKSDYTDTVRYKKLLIEKACFQETRSRETPQIGKEPSHDIWLNLCYTLLWKTKNNYLRFLDDTNDEERTTYLKQKY